jgi:hypothetical protein
MTDATVPSPRSRTVALLLAVLLGMFGAHRFYSGRTQSAIMMALTLGGAGLWWLYDLILVSAGSFRDAEGRLISAWEPEADRPALTSDATVAAMYEEIDQLRGEVISLTERVEFAERLLASPRKDWPEAQ